MFFDLQRRSDDGAMLGTLTISFPTLERPWADNARNLSCIPAGEYPLELRWSAHWNEPVIAVHDVPGRGDIEMHPANAVTQLAGCIAAGLEAVGDRVEHSRAAFEMLREIVRIAVKYDQRVTLRVTNPPVDSESGSSARA